MESVVALGHQVDVLTGKPNYPDGDVYLGYKIGGIHTEQWRGARLIRVPLMPRRTGSGKRLALNYISFVLSALLFAPLQIRGRTYEAVFVYAPSPITSALPAIFLGWIKRAPVTLWVQDLWPESLNATGHVKNPYVLRMVGLGVSWIYKHCDLLLVQSKEFVKPVSQISGATPVKYYPNSVDSGFAAASSADELPESLAMLGHGFNVVFAGNVGSAQAVEVIVEAAQALCDETEVRFVVIGQGSRHAWMEQEVQRRGLKNLHLPGRFPVEMMPAVMQKAGALLVTLTDAPIFSKTIPNKVQAYLASARPIIACLNGEGARIVEEAGAGIAVAAMDSQGLSQAVLQLFKMPQLDRDAMGKRGRAYFLDNFEHLKLVNELMAKLQETVNLKRRSA